MPTAAGKSSTTRRSARRENQDPIIAPGFGTAKDLQRLARDLSAGTGTSLPVEAVQAIMEAKGRGIRASSRRSGGHDEPAAAAAVTATPVSSAWADFMKEEGVGTTETTPPPPPVATSASGKRGRGDGEASATAATATEASSRVYSLEKTKKSKAETVAGVLVQSGTLDSAVVGRTKKFDLQDAHCLTEPTKILPGDDVTIKSVHTSGHACHSIAISSDGEAYGWGRNENQQLGSGLPNNVYQPVPLELPGAVQSAAVGKSHTLFLLEDGSVYAVGFNKAGQCGIKSSTEHVPNFRKCVFPDDMESEIVQVACGEDFSVALCDSGYIYTTGSSEFGQLGNGETGEYFLSASKMAFANCNAWTKRTTFCHAPAEKLYSTNDQTSKVVPLSEDIRIQQIACGKHHTLLLEADSDSGSPRLFSFGCGDYGVLGHGVQADEYYPRVIGTISNIRLPATGSSHMAVSAGQHCSLLQTVNGHVYYWGKHRSVGEATMRPTLVDVLANNQHVVTHAAAGGQTVVCCTANAQTVAWGQGLHGELGLGLQKKSSAKPTFVPGLDSCRVASLACGYGHSLFVVRNDDKEDKAAVKKLPTLDPEAIETLESNAAAAPAAVKGGKKK